MSFLVTVVVLLLLAWWWFKIARIPEKLPKGPYGLPLIGYLPLFWAENFIQGLETLHAKYGPNFSLNLGPGKRTVIIGDFETLKDAFKDDSLTARPPQMNWANVYFRYGNGEDSRGLIFSHGAEWTEQRRFALRSMRDLGFGKSSMEELIRTEVLQFMEFLDKDLNQPTNVANKFSISVINALWTLIAGKRYNLDDNELLAVVKKVDDLTHMSSNTSLINIFPFLRHVIPGLVGWNKILGMMNGICDFVGGVISKHLENFKNHPEIKDNPNDFIDSFLTKIDKSSPGSSFNGDLGIHNLQSGILDLLIAGTETTSTALSWATLFMIRYPDIQKKVQQEIDQVVGNSRLPEVADRPNLPMTESVIQEVLRMGCIAPLGLPRYAQEDVSIQNGKIIIPAGTIVMGNIFHIVNDPNVFPNPDQFNPDRFLDNEGKYVKNDRNIIFGTGKRDCLGKSLALTELFLFFSALMQRYNFEWLEKNNLDKIDTKPHTGFTQSPKPFKVIVTKRVEAN